MLKKIFLFAVLMAAAFNAAAEGLDYTDETNTTLFFSTQDVSYLFSPVEIIKNEIALYPVVPMGAKSVISIDIESLVQSIKLKTNLPYVDQKYEKIGRVILSNHGWACGVKVIYVTKTKTNYEEKSLPLLCLSLKRLREHFETLPETDSKLRKAFLIYAKERNPSLLEEWASKVRAARKEKKLFEHSIQI